jgi:pimeloyl-ACP methyl ester carboxylesterase
MVAYATNDGIRIFWDEKGTGTPLLLVMGATYTSAMWYPIVDALAEHHRVVWFDNRGVGQSEPSEVASIEDMAADAVAVLDAAGIEKAHVYGVSLGGVVVIQLALQSPERVASLILGCTGILNDEKPRAPKMDELAYVDRAKAAEAGRLGYGSAAELDAVDHDIAVLAAQPVTPIGLIQQQDALRAYSVSIDAVRGIPFTSLVLHGDEDMTVPVAWGRELADALPSSKLVVYPGAGHNYHVSYASQCSADILEFLADLTA